ncbi:hypothetical protein V8G54_012424 [Vigna mungo]|uniref:POT1A/B-like OB fold domain-containing protein n=1 Tax=Vigna mungo TaxID=3915 RepID=A0AAQ3NUP1_VIGMU
MERQRLDDDRLYLISGRIPYLSFLEPLLVTVNHHDHVRPVILMSVLTHLEVTIVFKCVVWVVAAMSREAEILCFSIGKYRMRLTLEYSTTVTHAYVIEEHVVESVKAQGF